MKRYCLLISFLMFFLEAGIAQISIQVNAGQEQLPVSPYIYGRNNSFSDNAGTATQGADITLYKEAGLRFARENGGNNATKYNWRRKISSHPDWYNNVYSHDWDFASESIREDMPGMQTMWAFQLVGKVAANKNNNFNDWAYNSSQWWSGVYQNLAGGGQVNTGGGSLALVNGDPSLYLMDWPADSTTGILDHWFGQGGLGLDKNKLLYWSMDNEPEIWNGTHDDVMPSQLRASEFMDRYFEVAKKAREKFPEVKLTGPVPCNEWQWYNWDNSPISEDRESYCWLEYFIKSVAEEQEATGIRLLDMIDVHWYPSESANATLLQLHRVFYDRSYSYPGANGVKAVNGAWDNSITQEYIFQRIGDWLTEYFGVNHGITIGLTEIDFPSSDPNIISVVYASMLGTFAENGVEIFSPWSWKTGMWETMHLFSRYSKSISVSTTSSLDATLSGYSTINSNADSMTIILVNRDLSSSRTANVNISGFALPDGNYSTLELSSLPANETFVSHTSNALESGTVNLTGNSFNITLPSVSTTAVILTKTGTGIVQNTHDSYGAQSLKLLPNPAKNAVRIEFLNEQPVTSGVIVYNQDGRQIDACNWEYSGLSPLTINTENYHEGTYFVKVTNRIFTETRKLIIVK